TGRLLPVEALAAAANEAGVPLVVDASQSAGHVPLSLPALGASAVAMPGHKGLLGPSGTGLLYLAPGVEVEPLLRGGTGSQSESEYQPDFAPDRYESGTLNAMGIVGLGAAAEHLREVGVERVQDRLTELGRRFRDGLAGADGVTLHGPADPAVGVGIASPSACCSGPTCRRGSCRGRAKSARIAASPSRSSGNRSLRSNRR